MEDRGGRGEIGSGGRRGGDTPNGTPVVRVRYSPPRRCDRGKGCLDIVGQVRKGRGAMDLRERLVMWFWLGVFWVMLLGVGLLAVILAILMVGLQGLWP